MRPTGRAAAVVPLLLAALGLPRAAVAEASVGESRLVDSVVAVVGAAGSDGRAGRTILTLTELELEARVAIIGRGGIAAAEGPIPRETLAATLDWLISEHLLLFEAEQLNVAQVEPADLQEALSRFQGRFPAPEAYRAFLVRYELSEAELGRILRRNLVVSRYFESRVRLSVAVSEEDVRGAYERRKAELGGKDLEEVRPTLRAIVEKEKREELVSALIADLRSRAEVRVLLAIGSGRRSNPNAPAPSTPSEDELHEADE